MNIQGVTIIKSETHSIMTLMRLNTRWAQAKSRMARDALLLQGEGPLVQRFRRLNEYLEGIFDLREVDCVTYLSPFHQIIVSDQANGPLTSAALSSLSKFVLYGFLSPECPRAKEGILLVANCISHCIFEETDWESDEIIFMKLLELSALVFRCDASPLLTIAATWEIYSTCLEIHSQCRASKLLRSEAETTLRHLTLTAFSRAHIAARLDAPTRILEPLSVVTTDSHASPSTADNLHLETHFFTGEGITLALVKIMTILAGLLDVQAHPADGVKFALSLVNVALEAGGPALGSMTPLVDILRGEVCRHLLRASQSDDLAMFSLCLRVVFNLFMSNKDHIKVQLEVFLTSVHLRLLQQDQSLRSRGSQVGTGSKAAKERDPSRHAKEELALESLLEFCREPSLMYDLYTNYDCDVQCTNLFDSIITALCVRAVPVRVALASSADLIDAGGDSMRVSILNRLALDGVFAVLHAVASRCSAHVNDHDEDEYTTDSAGLYRHSSPSAANGHIRAHSVSLPSLDGPGLAFDPLGNSGRMRQYAPGASVDIDAAVDNWCTTDPELSEPSSQIPLLSIPSTDMTRDQRDSVCITTPTKAHSNGLTGLLQASPYSSTDALDPTLIGAPLALMHSNSFPTSSSDGNISGGQNSGENADGEFMLLARARTADVLRQRKLKKQQLRESADLFNAHPLKPDWVKFALDLGLLPAADTTGQDSELCEAVADARGVARFLKNTPGLGKTQVGEYLSKGPADRYPFHAQVLKEYVDTFDFTGSNCSFVRALRLFLGHFRLPGEAQCIDRLMEAFARRLFEHQGVGNPFASSDAAFVLSFSTIMLNTDLHNPNLPPSKKMTKEQFIRNNRDINDGADLPRDYLECLYEEIKARQIQVDVEITDYSDSSAATASLTDASSWRRMLKRAAYQAPASFTPTITARSTATRRSGIGLYPPPSIHERDMFVVMARPVLETLDTVLGTVCRDDDLLTGRLIQAVLDFASVCVSLGLDQTLSWLMTTLASRTRQILSFAHTSSEEEKDDYLLEGEVGHDAVSQGDLEHLVGQGFESMLRGRSAASAIGGAYSPYRPIDGSLVPAHQGAVLSPNPAGRALAAHWLGAKEVRGEILLRALFMIAGRYSGKIRGDGWAALVGLLLYVRTMGVLPSGLAVISDELSFTESAAPTPTVKHTPTEFAHRCHRNARGQNLTEQKQSVGLFGGIVGLLWGADQQLSRREGVLDGNSCHSMYESLSDTSSRRANQLNLLKLALLHSQAESLLLDSSDGQECLVDTLLSTLRELVGSLSSGLYSSVEGTEESLSDQELQGVLLLEWVCGMVFGASAASVSNEPPTNSTTPLALWPPFADLLVYILEQIPDEAASKFPYLLERVVVSLFRAALLILPNHQSRTAPNHTTHITSRARPKSADELVWHCLRLLGALPRFVLTPLSPLLGRAIGEMIHRHISVEARVGDEKIENASVVVAMDGSMQCTSLAHSTEQWHTLVSLLAAATATESGRQEAWSTLCLLLDSSQITPLSIGPCRLLLLRFLHGAYPEDDSDSPSTSTTCDTPPNMYVESAMVRMVSLVARVFGGYSEPKTTGNNPNQPKTTISHQKSNQNGIVTAINPTVLSSLSPVSHSPKTDPSATSPNPLPANAPSIDNRDMHPVQLPRQEVEGMWLDTVNRIGDICSSPESLSRPHGRSADMRSGHTSSTRRVALNCIHSLLAQGKAADLPPSCWIAVVPDLLSRLPLLLSSKRTAFSSQHTSDSNAEDSVLDSICINSTNAVDVAEVSCSLLFDLSMGLVKQARQNALFSSSWVKFAEVLAVNARETYKHRLQPSNQSVTPSIAFGNEMIEMIMAALRLRCPPLPASVSAIVPVVQPPTLGSGLLRLVSPLIGTEANSSITEQPSSSIPLTLTSTQSNDAQLLTRSFRSMLGVYPALSSVLHDRCPHLMGDLLRIVVAVESGAMLVSSFTDQDGAAGLTAGIAPTPDTIAGMEETALIPSVISAPLDQNKAVAQPRQGSIHLYPGELTAPTVAKVDPVVDTSSMASTAPPSNAEDPHSPLIPGHIQSSTCAANVAAEPMVNTLPTASPASPPTTVPVPTPAASAALPVVAAVAPSPIAPMARLLPKNVFVI